MTGQGASCVWRTVHDREGTLIVKLRKKRYLLPALGATALAVGLAPLASAAATTTAATTTAATSTQAATPTVQVCGQGAALIKPGSMILTCADDGELAQNLHWTSWTATQATATGTVTWRACADMCAESKHFDSTTADYTLSDPVRSGSKILFTRLELHATGTTPKGFQRNLAFDEAPSNTPAPKFDGRHARLGAKAAPSGSLSYAEIEGYWLYAGGPNSQEGNYNQAQIAAAITGAESSFLPGEIQEGVDYCGPGSDRAGWGLWQITCGNSVPQYGSDFQVLDPWNNAEAAVYKCKQDASAGYNCFTPWSTWASGAYTQYLSNAGADMSISDPGEYVQIGSTPPGTPSSPGPAPGSTYGPPMPNSRPAAPSVTLTSPGTGGLVGGNVTVTASASDSTSGVSLSTQLYVDGQAYGSATGGTSPSITWNSTAVNGLHTLMVKTTASNSAGSASTSSATITVHVVNGFQSVFNAASTNALYLYGNGTGAKDGKTPVGVAPGTSPAVARLASGGFEVAFNAANTNALFLYGQGPGSVDGKTPVGIAKGTSPAIVALPGGGFQVVFSAASTHTLWRYGHGAGSYTGSTPVGLAPGTSPSLAELTSGGYEVAFNANSTNALYLYGNGPGAVIGKTPVGVATTTSPAIAALPGGGFQVVFSAHSSDTLWRYGHGAGSYTGSTPVGLAPGTSPAIAVLSGGGYEAAFNAASTNALYLYGNGPGVVDGKTPVGLAKTTSPAIMALPGNGFQIVFSAASTDTLWRYGHGAGSYTGSTPVGLAPNTSPSIA
jgi:hypothetical protein